jgi:tetratricopeptide (TPR) repeat protein
MMMRDCVSEKDASNIHARPPWHLLRVLPLCCLSLFLVAAASANQDPEELVRKANAAFNRQEFDLALKLYTEAEAIIENPGLVSFNKGAALYRLGRFPDAEAHYRRCLEEADPKRKPAMIYNLANCLVQRAQAGSDVALFREAVETYQRCLGEEEITTELQQNARHNLELAKLLWLQARLARASQQENDPGQENKPEQPKPPDKTPQEQEKTEQGADPSSGAKPKQIAEKKSKMEKKQGDDKAIPTDEPSAGRGNTPPPPDDAKLKPLSTEDAQKNIDTAMERIRKERSGYRLRAAPVASREVPDW